MNASESHWIILTRTPSGWKHLIHYILEKWQGRPRQGHVSLITNTVRALKLCGAKVKLNPISLSKNTTHILLMHGGPPVVQWAARRRSAHSSVWVGLAPVIANSNSSAMHEITMYGASWARQLVASDWQRHLMLRAHPELTGRVDIWPCGVDTEWWKPASQLRQPHRLLVYRKRAPADIIVAFEAAAVKAGWTLEIIDYGHYQPTDFRTALQRCSAALFSATGNPKASR